MNINRRTDKNGNISYQIRVFLNEDGNGRQITRSMTWKPPLTMSAKAAEKEAARQAILFESEVKSGRVALSDKTSFCETATAYIQNTDMRPRSRDWYLYMLAIAKDEFGNRPIGNIKACEIEHLYADMRAPDAMITYSAVAGASFEVERKKKKLSQKALAEKAEVSVSTVKAVCRGKNVSVPSADKIAAVIGEPTKKLFEIEKKEQPYADYTISGLHRFFRAIFHYARMHKVIVDNPMDAVRTPKVDGEIKILTEAESGKFYAALLEERDIRIKTALLILAYCGLRKAELCGLTWDDVDIDNKRLRIAHQAYKATGAETEMVSVKTKASKAVLPMADAVVNAIVDYQSWWNAHADMYGDAWRGQMGCLFIQDDGRPINPRTINDWVDRVTARAGLPHITVHSLRHLCGTLLIRAGVDAKVVQKVLRHASIKTTCDIYVDVFDSVQRDALQSVQQSLEQSLENNLADNAAAKTH